ncbi:MAG TPA: hypothetical protein VHK06_00330, partial [Candidatus Limnocylindria bacterium]|nr:hypothetical protein [Candidatus Limnocylindria bacterium]
MNDGHSISDAATLLGVPAERVWELLARGVLAGEPLDDGGYRVFLGSAAPGEAGRSRRGTTAADPPPGGAASASDFSGAERGAFRELLTEFRNLTERYGQALLALGEARGEVAALLH